MIRLPNTNYQPLVFSSCNRKDNLIKGGKEPMSSWHSLKLFLAATQVFLRQISSKLDFFVNYVWLAYHFMLNTFSTYLRILWIPRLFVLGRVVGRVRPGGDSPPCQRFLCLPRAKPSNGERRTRPQQVTTLPLKLVLHCYWGTKIEQSNHAVTANFTVGSTE